MKFIKHKISKRSAAVIVALIAVAGAVTGREKPAVELIEPKAARVEATTVEVDIDLDKLQRAEASLPQNDPFARRSFAPEPQQAVAHAAPVAPSAPPLPFRYFGKLTKQGKTEVFVMRGDDLISIAAGQKVDAQYRVDGISDSAISFTYLPLNTRQRIEL